LKAKSSPGWVVVSSTIEAKAATELQQSSKTQNTWNSSTINLSLKSQLVAITACSSVRRASARYMALAVVFMVRMAAIFSIRQTQKGSNCQNRVLEFKTLTKQSALEKHLESAKTYKE
jgi:hypothetical protein